MVQEFFDEQLDQSRAKSEIVVKYFDVWSKIISNKNSSNIAYVDLFCGPGRYRDGSESTPLLLLKKVLENDRLCQRFICLFTDMNRDSIRSLKNEIANIDGIKKLKFPPEIFQEEINVKIVNQLSNIKLIPSFVFLDPCGYKGLSLDLINAIIKDWGCECLFFFNYLRINAGIQNKFVEQHINDIFGEIIAEQLRVELLGKTPYQREKIILDYLTKALKQNYGKFVQPFCVKKEDQNRTSHYLIFITKNFLGYEIMREVMANYSSNFVQGVPTFEYNKYYEPDMFHQPLNTLKESLIKEFAGKTISVYDTFRSHSQGRSYVIRNYKDALKELLTENKIKAITPNGKPPRAGTMANTVNITFISE